MPPTENSPPCLAGIVRTAAQPARWTPPTPLPPTTAPAADTRALSFGKMSTALYLQTEVMILKSSSTNCCTLPGQTSLFDSTESGGALQGMEKLPTVLSMRNIGECPSVANVSMLSLILVENPPTKYYLTVKAMNGILDRASRRGKPLPDLLTTAIAGMKEWYKQNPPGGGISPTR